MNGEEPETSSPTADEEGFGQSKRLNEDAIGCEEAGEDSMGRMAKAYSVNLLFSEGIFSESDCGRDTVKLETEKLSHDGKWQAFSD